MDRSCAICAKGETSERRKISSSALLRQQVPRGPVPAAAFHGISGRKAHRSVNHRPPASIGEARFLLVIAVLMLLWNSGDVSLVSGLQFHRFDVEPQISAAAEIPCSRS